MAENLAANVFSVLRGKYFDPNGNPVAFALRPKRNTQDDPLDEHICKMLQASLADAECQKSSGPLITPDMVVYRPSKCSELSRDELRQDDSSVIGVEVKKLERASNGRIARATGLDYNTTPPCGTVRVYDAKDEPLDIRGYYLFVCQEPARGRKSVISSLVLCDGNLLNEDFQLYLRITSRRQKEINLGTYGNGANRQRPMLIFTNPIGAPALDHSCTLIVSANIEPDDERLKKVYEIERTIPKDDSRVFNAYRARQDVVADWKVNRLTDPFPQPTTRVTVTQPRGRFKVPILPK